MADETKEYSAHEDMQNFFEGLGTGRISLNESPTESSDQSSSTDATAKDAAGTEAQIPTAPPVPDEKEQRLAELEKFAAEAKSAKAYQQIQSRADKAEAALKAQTEQLYAKIAQLEQRLAAPQQEQFGDQGQQYNPAAIQQLVDQRAAQIAQQVLEQHPGVRAGQAMREWAQFSQDNPDIQKYAFIIQPFIERSPDVPGESYYDKLGRAMDFAKHIEAMSLRNASTANTQAQAATNGNPNPATQSPGQRQSPPPPSLSAQPKQYLPEQGMAASAPAGETWKPDYRRPLQQQVRDLLSSYNRKNR